MIVGGDVVDRIARVDLRFKRLYFKLCDFRSADLADEFFGFATKHTADNDFNPALRIVRTTKVVVHGYPLIS